MKQVFWLCTALTVYTYFGYFLWLWLLSHLFKRPVMKGSLSPEVSIIIAARNEASNLPAKLENLRVLHYDQERLQIIIASDGSTDDTASILRRQFPQIISVILEESKGKGFALNEAAKLATGEILIFLDARQAVDPNAVLELVSCFADPSVGAVSGELIFDDDCNPTSTGALGSYWKMEKTLRKLESASGSVVGVTGAIYAIRRELYTEIPPWTILDDVFVPMNVSRMNKRVVFEPKAIARDKLFIEKGKEFSRKVRTLTGNYQLLRLAPWLFSPDNPLLFRFISHKLLRLVSPLFLVIMLLASAMSKGLFYRIAFWLQIFFYILAAFGTLKPSTKKFRPVAIADTFVMLNVAAVLAFHNFITRRATIWH